MVAISWHLTMRSSFLLLFAALAIATASSVSESGKKAIADALDHAKKELETKLNGTDKSVLVPPTKLLTELAAAGQKDQDLIAAFGDDDQVKPYLNSSLIFWKSKLNAVIFPYVTNPKAYENLVIDFPVTPEVPCNTTQAYKDAEREITEIVKNGSEELQKKYSAALKEMKAKSIREITCSTYFGLLITRAHNELQEFLVNNEKWAKHDSAKGEMEEAIKSLKAEIENYHKEFDQACTNVCKQFKNCTKT